MLKAQQLTLAVLIQATMISSAIASEQSEAKGFVEDAEASVLFRTGYLTRDKKNGVPDTSSTAQTAIVDIDSGFTQGTVGFGVGFVGDASFKLGSNNHAGNNMIPKKSTTGTAYDTWARGGANVKARISNTTLRYGTQVLDIPVLASNTARLVPEYFTGTLLTSHEIENLEVIGGKFTKNSLSDQINTDGQKLRSAWVWGAKYQFDDNLKAAYYGLDVKDKLDRHYINANYKIPFADKDSLTLDFSGYRTTFKPEASIYSATGPLGEDKTNNIWAVSGTYNQGPHTVMLAYQQNTGNVGYDYGGNGDGMQSIYLPNSYLSDFIGNREKSAQLQYNLDLGAFGVPGLNWTTAYVYGWNIHVADKDPNQLISDNATEREFFNQVKYTVQSGFAKGVNLRLRNSYYRASAAYQQAYIGDTNEWRIFLDIPVKFL
ncbi:OprD family outer membrane porin [Acinetobacter rudis]|uniref:OprD family outer membrane porin n=1 Tax=Acinetobacter rudis TaxID=632955 RepID=UPI00280D7F33|nr:OprD family outer membrane porin [Acinetobacter rudis]MDQ8952647.1 OprD family outer membrane porin [Acinetobacter rudis]